MPGRILRCFVVTGLIVSMGMLPWSSAQAAPARQSLSASLGTVAQTVHRLVTAFRLLLQGQPNGNPPDGDPGGNPSSKPQDGVAIDPHGNPGQRGN